MYCPCRTSAGSLVLGTTLVLNSGIDLVGDLECDVWNCPTDASSLLFDLETDKLCPVVDDPGFEGICEASVRVLCKYVIDVEKDRLYPADFDHDDSTCAASACVLCTHHTRASNWSPMHTVLYACVCFDSHGPRESQVRSAAPQTGKRGQFPRKMMW